MFWGVKYKQVNLVRKEGESYNEQSCKYSPQRELSGDNLGKVPTWHDHIMFTSHFIVIFLHLYESNKMKSISSISIVSINLIYNEAIIEIQEMSFVFSKNFQDYYFQIIMGERC